MSGFTRFAAMLVVLGVSSMTAGLPENYETWSADKKLEYQYGKVLETRYQKLPNVNYPTLGQCVGAFALLNLRPSFTHQGDEMPFARAKMLHPYGSVGILRARMNSKKFTGQFAAGEIDLLGRLSLAAPPVVAGVTPGFAWKRYFPGQPSRNLHTMHSIDGQKGNTDLFAHAFTNKIPDPTGTATWLLGEYFRWTAAHPDHMTLGHFASVNSDGSEVANPVVPFQIIFEPSGKLSMPSSSPNDFREDLLALAPGTVLYDRIILVDEKGVREEVGDVTLVRPFVASYYGDHWLFFRHETDSLRK